MMIVLDTHIWLWWINRDPSRLKPAWTARIESAEPVDVSAISCFEIAWLTRHGRIELPIPEDDWFDKALAGSGIALLPITPRIARTAVPYAVGHGVATEALISPRPLGEGSGVRAWVTASTTRNRACATPSPKPPAANCSTACWPLITSGMRRKWRQNE